MHERSHQSETHGWAAAEGLKEGPKALALLTPVPDSDEQIALLDRDASCQ